MLIWKVVSYQRSGLINLVFNMENSKSIISEKLVTLLNIFESLAFESIVSMESSILTEILNHFDSNFMKFYQKKF